MNWHTDLITKLARSIRDGKPEIADGNLTMPAVMTPIVSLRDDVHSHFAASPGIVAVQPDSWSFQTQTTRVNQGNLLSGIARIAPGLWDVYVELLFQCDFTVQGSQAAEWEFLSIGGPSEMLGVCRLAQHTGQFFRKAHFLIHFPTITEVDLFHPGNGVGQSSSLHGSILCNRLN